MLKLFLWRMKVGGEPLAFVAVLIFSGILAFNLAVLIYISTASHIPGRVISIDKTKDQMMIQYELNNKLQFLKLSRGNLALGKGESVDLLKIPFSEKLAVLDWTDSLEWIVSSCFCIAFCIIAIKLFRKIPTDFSVC